jgi:hypothetical protein
MVVIDGDINDRNRNSRGLEAAPHLDPGLIIQVDVEDDAERPADVVVILKSLSRVEQHAVIAVLVVTDMAVIGFSGGRITLLEIAPGMSRG